MRKVTRESVNAFFNGNEYKQGDTQVKVLSSEHEVFKQSHLLLHGHVIAIYDFYSGNLKISNCGYSTPTTKERLNGVLSEAFGYEITNKLYYIFQHKYDWYITDGTIDRKWEYFNKYNEIITGNYRNHYINRMDLERGFN